jgi:excisionase family DNA binding protein
MSIMPSHEEDTPAILAPNEWLSLQEACDYLGMAASTVRRWADSGKIPTKRTLGGHRRFSRTALLHLLHQESTESATSPTSEATSTISLRRWSIDISQLAHQPWHLHVSDRAGTERMRELGQRLLGLFIQHINSDATDTRFLEEARRVGATYGVEAHVVGISMHDLVEAFLFFRHAISQLAAPVPVSMSAADVADANTLHLHIDLFMDAILLGAIASYEQHCRSSSV